MKNGDRKKQQPEPDLNQEKSVLPDAPEPSPESKSSDTLYSALEDIERFRSLAQRAQADLVNYKRRIEEERIVFAQNANNNLILKLLPIIDDFDLAIAHTPDGVDSSWSTGIELILKKLQVVIFSFSSNIFFIKNTRPSGELWPKDWFG